MYEEAFPVEERRSLHQQRNLLGNPAYQFASILYLDEFAGLFGIWHLPGVTFLEHFAILPNLRGKGVGQEALQHLIKKSSPISILEVEPPLTDTAKRRISFYERAGFHLNPFEYWQPPYEENKPWVKLQLMSSPNFLKANEFEAMKGQLYKSVYLQDPT
nr:GNAT family N-acetyltransferase [Rufibacter latericius]